MPAKNSVKTYLENAYYHIYNRGVEERLIFQDQEDYKVFLSFVKRYLVVLTQNEVQPRWNTDVSEKILLAAYCLMPNHFHFLVKQITEDGVTEFMRALMNSYVGYFNQKYKRVGGLFQGIFKAAYIDNEAYLLHLTRYIHLNPIELAEMSMKKLEDYYCSYGEYIGKRNTSWISCDEVLGHFGSKLAGIGSFDSYKDFVEEYQGDSREELGSLTLE